MRAAIFASGGGSNLQSIIDDEIEGLTIALVFSNKAAPYAFDRAKKHNIPTIHLAPKSYKDRRAYDTAIVELMRDNDIELIILAGYMLVVTDILVDAFPEAIINIHPALLPAFPGLGVQKKAIDYGVKFSGCTVHFVDKGVDTGPIIIQAVVPVLDDDTPDLLAARILKEEHRIYPAAIRLLINDSLIINGHRVLYKDAK